MPETARSSLRMDYAETTGETPLPGMWPTQ